MGRDGNVLDGAPIQRILDLLRNGSSVVARSAELLRLRRATIGTPWGHALSAEQTVSSR